MNDEQSRFWSKAARNYDRVVDSQIGPTTRSMVRERIGREVALGKVVEFGCGTGFYTQALASKADSVVATDISSGMLALAQELVKTSNVKFRIEDCQETSFAAEAFDTAFMSLVNHFTDPEKTVAEIRRILKPGGAFIISNLDIGGLRGLDLIRCRIRVVYRGLIGYRMKPPKGLGDNVMSEKQLCDLLGKLEFKILNTETIRDMSRSSHIPVQYIKAANV
jgi:ubiquinone/menaquinone biosynthesis C-methylase UbiE